MVLACGKDVGNLPCEILSHALSYLRPSCFLSDNTASRGKVARVSLDCRSTAEWRMCCGLLGLHHCSRRSGPARRTSCDVRDLFVSTHVSPGDQTLCYGISVGFSDKCGRNEGDEYDDCEDVDMLLSIIFVCDCDSCLKENAFCLVSTRHVMTLPICQEILSQPRFQFISSQSKQTYCSQTHGQQRFYGHKTGDIVGNENVEHRLMISIESFNSGVQRRDIQAFSTLQNCLRMLKELLRVMKKLQWQTCCVAPSRSRWEVLRMRLLSIISAMVKCRFQEVEACDWVHSAE
eukprot:746000-Hanusia_phi.AAC.3